MGRSVKVGDTLEIKEMKGTVAIDPTYREGFRLVVKLRK